MKGTRKMDLGEAAEALGVTREAVRRRAKRGTLESERGDDGRLYVWVDDVHHTDEDDLHRDEHDALVEELKDRIRSLETANAEMRRLLAGMIERIPELEAPEKPAESPENVAEGSGVTQDGEEPPETISKPWWRRMFGA